MSHQEVNRGYWAGRRRTTPRPRGATGPRPSRAGASGGSRRPRSARCPTSTASTPSSSAAAPPTSPPGSPSAARRPVGIDQSPEQLATARAMQAEHGLEFPLIEGDAEAVPPPDASFDFALSEYGASLWCDPERWIAEAARLLRPGGRLVFLTNSPLVILCSAPDSQVGAPTASRARSSGCGASSGTTPTATRSSSTSPTARCSASCANAASRSRRSTSCTRPRTRPPATSG